MSVTIREPGSAITHFIGMMMAILASTPLLIKAVLSGQPVIFFAMVVFIASMILLYGASATYHSINVGGRILRVFRKLDHMMIFVLIAGSYTPVCLVILGGRLGYTLLAVVWGVAILGMAVKAFWITCPKWFSPSSISPWGGSAWAFSASSGIPSRARPFCGFSPEG